MRKNNGGMSFIELVLVIVILSLVTTGGIAIYKSLGFANTKKAANLINDSLSKARIDTMSKKGTQYLYLYQIDGKLYSKVSTEGALSVGVPGELTATEGKGFSRNISLRYKTGAGTTHELADDESICLYFAKASGAFVSDYSEIILISGNNSSVITCIKETGRHWVD
ncbi:MAG: hypothetical protein GX379_02110 [Clostridiales bacterium]|nr:hypothetical protein [Clostridiales bacterium]